MHRNGGHPADPAGMPAHGFPRVDFVRSRADFPQLSSISRCTTATLATWHWDSSQYRSTGLTGRTGAKQTGADTCGHRYVPPSVLGRHVGFRPATGNNRHLHRCPQSQHPRRALPAEAIRVLSRARTNNVLSDRDVWIIPPLRHHLPAALRSHQHPPLPSTHLLAQLLPQYPPFKSSSNSRNSVQPTPTTPCPETQAA